MNEKIKEIMYKVDDINILNEVGTDADFLADIDPQRLEKFAELIIQECIKICDKVQIKYGQYTFTARICKEDIKEHFGVEE